MYNLDSRCLWNFALVDFCDWKTVFTWSIKLIQGAHALYKPTRSDVVSSMDSLCLDVQKNQKNGHHESLQQCDYEIEYADRSFSLGVLIRDDLHLVSKNGSKIKLNFVFGYESLLFLQLYLFLLAIMYCKKLMIHSMLYFFIKVWIWSRRLTFEHIGKDRWNHGTEQGKSEPT